MRNNRIGVKLDLIPVRTIKEGKTLLKEYMYEKS